MPLLFTPTAKLVCLENLNVIFEAVATHKVGSHEVDLKDGQAEIFPDLLDDPACTEHFDVQRGKDCQILYNSFQFRGTFHDTDAKQMYICKGMFQVNMKLPPRTVVLPASTVKVKGAVDETISTGIDCVKYNETIFDNPGTSASLVSALMLRTVPLRILRGGHF